MNPGDVYGTHSCGGELRVVDVLPAGRCFVECEGCDQAFAAAQERSEQPTLSPEQRGDYDF